MSQRIRNDRQKSSSMSGTSRTRPARRATMKAARQVEGKLEGSNPERLPRKPRAGYFSSSPTQSAKTMMPATDASRRLVGEGIGFKSDQVDLQSHATSATSATFAA